MAFYSYAPAGAFESNEVSAMALLRIGNWHFGTNRNAALTNYDDEEPYMPGGSRDADYGDDYSRDDYEAGYDDAGDGEYDDGYDDGYDGYGDGYADEYEDDYADDYGDDYGDDGYYDDPGYDDPGYDEGGPEYPSGAWGAVLRYMDEHDWVTLALLFLLPPAGIWLLWRRQRYSRNVTIALSALSVLWLALLLLLLLLRPFRPKGDSVITPQPVGAATQGMTEQPAPTEAPEESVAEVVSEEEVDEATAVYVAEGLPYYHKQDDCVNIPEDGKLSRISENTAIERSLMACPYCMGSAYSDGQWDLVFVNGDTEDKSNIRVYCSAFNSHFHTDPACSDLGTDAHEVPLKDALLMSKTTCTVCCPTSAMMVYCTLDGTYYHAKADCSGMRNASYVTYAEARVTGKKRCPKCIGGTDETEEHAAEGEGDATYYVYATPNGAYYHIQENCSGMKNAQRVPLADMLASNRPACPVCCPDAETIVYAETGNPYYHSNNTCSGMTNAQQGLLVNALAAGLQRCPECWTAAQ